MSVPVFSSVVYLSPWLPLPPGWSKVGLDVIVGSGAPLGQVLAGRLRQGGTTLKVGVGAGPTEVVLVPDAPLSAMLDYAVDVQWVASGTSPGSIQWNAGSYATAPVVTATVTLDEASVSGSTVSLAWDFGSTATQPAGANVSAYSDAGRSVGFTRVQGTSGTLTLSSSATLGAQLYLQAVMPIDGTPGTGFVAPFTMGPIVSGNPLPLAAPAVTSADFDGTRVTVGWTPPSAPTTGGTVGYDLVVQSAGSASRFAAASSGGLAVLGAGASSALSISGAVRFGAIAGAPGTALDLLTQAPAIDAIAVSGTSVSARVTFPAGTPSGASAAVKLLLNGVEKGSATATSSGVTVSLAGLTTSPTDGWTVVASMAATVSGAALTGPTSLPVEVLAAPPVIDAITMVPDAGDSTKWAVTVSAGAPPPAGASLAIALSQGGTAVASLSLSGSAVARFTLAQGTAAANTIDGSTVAQATASLTNGRATSPSAGATFIGSAPVISSVQNIGASDPTGQAQGLQLDVASAESGKAPVVRLMGNGATVATASGTSGGTHVNLPLDRPLDPSISWTVQARWTGGGVDASTFGGWSAPVAVLTATTSVVSADFDAGTLAVAIQPPQSSTPAQGAYIFAYDATGGQVRGANVIGTRATIALTPGTATWQAGAKPFQPLPASSNSRTIAPSSALAPLLLDAPSLSRLDYDGAVVSAAWSVVQDAAGNDATGAVIKVSDGAGSIVTQAAGSGSGEVAVQLSPGAQASAAVSVRATSDAGGIHASGAYSAAATPLVAAPTVGTVSVDVAGGTVAAVLTPPTDVPAGTTYQGWLMAGDHQVAGPESGSTSLGFTYAAAGVSGLSIVAQATATIDSIALTGPKSVPVPVLAIAPEFVGVTIAPSTTAGDWQLDAVWAPPADGSAVTTYTLKLDKDGGTNVFEQSFGSATSGAKSFAASAVSTTAANPLTLWATSANGSTTPAASLDVWFAAPAFSAMTAGATQVTAQWSAAAGPENAAYRLNLLDAANGAVLAGVTTTATSGGIATGDLGLDPGGSYKLALAVISGPVTFVPDDDGTAKTRPSLLLARPQGLVAATDASTRKATITWQAVSGASGYTVSFSDGRAAVAVTAATYALTTALDPGDDLAVSVTANIVADGVTSTGPASSWLVIPTAAPALTSADCDGGSVSASWQEVAGAVGYVATLLDKDGNSAGTSAQVAALSVVFDATLEASSGPYTVVVQAVTAAGTGLPSDALPVFTAAWFISTQAPADAPPNIYPASTLALEPEEITLYLPALAAQTITVDPVGPFALAANTDTGSKDAFPYTLTMAADSDVWAFTADGNPLPPIRPDLKTNYVNFLKAAETAGASPSGISILQQAISRGMPQTFDESHYYAYGLDLTGGKGTGSIDLRQGLVLRVGFADYTNVWSGDTNSWLNGFGGGSPNDYDVADGLSGSGAWQLSMDAFTAQLTASGAMTVSPPTTLVSAATAAGVADAADLFFPGFPNPFYRLFFPGELQTPTSTGSVATTSNFGLASAATYTALASSSNTPGTNTPVAYFRGRAVLRMMVRVRINDMELVVPLGTTLGNLLDRYGVRPPASPVKLAGVSLERGGGPGVAVFGTSPTPPAAVYDSARRHRVRLDWGTMATYGGPVDATNLPLLHGDRIEF
ncbi:hypothetical protein C8N35_11154 [Breoghania corrubedonensis]|uniref:Fibronectin type-III domain-containing protein n=1 Tax=Breoghania corrubedonensis TaxID=665038 RepID=A0A2T5UYP1_9HYPH|nr:hypothetical protein [Breoghania corrubedonensis]PTW56591.1 hypothetical protein C8N35_11154 [Breoghania corrubedonensis]